GRSRASCSTAPPTRRFAPTRSTHTTRSTHATRATRATHAWRSPPSWAAPRGPRWQARATSSARSSAPAGWRRGSGGAMIGAEGFVRKVAIKRVLSGLSQVPAFATMFAAEAQIASRLAHPNIVSVLDFHRDAEQRLLLVMEFVDGKDLATLLAAGPI